LKINSTIASNIYNSTYCDFLPSALLCISMDFCKNFYHQTQTNLKIFKLPENIQIKLSKLIKTACICFPTTMSFQHPTNEYCFAAPTFEPYPPSMASSPGRSPNRALFFPAIPPHSRLFPAIHRLEAEKLLQEYPNGNSLSPCANGSIPDTPVDGVENSDAELKVHLRDYMEALLDGFTEDESWEGRQEVLNIEARIGEREWRAILGPEKEVDSNFVEDEQEKQEREEKNRPKLDAIMAEIRLNREQWRRAEMKIGRYFPGQKCYKERMEEAEARRACKVVGLVHVMDLEERLEEAERDLREGGLEVWPIWPDRDNLAFDSLGYGYKNFRIASKSRSEDEEDDVYVESDSWLSVLDGLFPEDAAGDTNMQQTDSEMPDVWEETVAPQWGGEDAAGDPYDEYFSALASAYITGPVETSLEDNEYFAHLTSAVITEPMDFSFEENHEMDFDHSLAEERSAFERSEDLNVISFEELLADAMCDFVVPEFEKMDFEGSLAETMFGFGSSEETNSESRQRIDSGMGMRAVLSS